MQLLWIFFRLPSIIIMAIFFTKSICYGVCRMATIRKATCLEVSSVWRLWPTTLASAMEYSRFARR